VKNIQQLIDNNADWVKTITDKQPDYFKKMVAGQQPQFLWIGCADSRLRAATSVGLEAGEMFVHRNISNLVSPDDTSCTAIIEFAVNALGVSDIIVCGHYGCGGVNAAMHMADKPANVVEEWVYPVKQLYDAKRAELEKLEESKRFDTMCELNVLAQVNNVFNHPAVAGALASDRKITVHALIYDLASGRLKSLPFSQPN